MTLPSGGYPPGSITNPSGTGLSAHSQKTQDQWKAEQTGAMSGSYEGNYWSKMVSNMFGGFLGGLGQFIAELVLGIFGFAGSMLDLVGGFLGVRNDAEDAVAQAGEVSEGLTELTNRVEVLEGGTLTIRTYAFNATWAKPAGLYRLGVAVEGGGSAGRSGGTLAPNRGGLGGLSGGYQFQWFEEDAIASIGATVPVTVGAGGATPSQAGGVSRFGTHLASIPGVGAVLTIEGSQLSNSAAGPGGDGGNAGNANTGVVLSAGTAGGGSAFASGGNGGAANGSAGGNGGNAVISPRTRGNGGSGGGGGGTSDFANGGKGGNGGYPSGGGGGGGSRSAAFTSEGAGGTAADGRVTTIEYTRGI